MKWYWNCIKLWGIILIVMGVKPVVVWWMSNFIFRHSFFLCGKTWYTYENGNIEFLYENIEQYIKHDWVVREYYGFFFWVFFVWYNISNKVILLSKFGVLHVFACVLFRRKRLNNKYWRYVQITIAFDSNLFIKSLPLLLLLLCLYLQAITID